MGKRIAISGASGTGKTTLANWVEEFYKVPFISTSTKVLWEEWGIETHQQIVEKSIKEPQWGIDWQFTLLDYREKTLADKEEWVSDRGGLDNIVYFLNQCSMYCDKKTSDEYLTKALNLIKNQTHQIVLCFSDEIPEQKMNNGFRVVNPHYQYMIDAIIERVSNVYLRLTQTSTIIIPYWDLQQRKDAVMKFLTNLTLPNENGKEGGIHSV